jgi:hypothetical protein
MACGTPGRPVKFEVALDTKGQTREKVQAIVESLLRQNNAIECGIMAAFSVTFSESADVEETPEMKKAGVRSMTKEAAG